MSDKYNNIDLFHEFDIYYPSKTITLFGEINQESRDKFIKNLHSLDESSGEITILISSEGGDVEEGLSIYDYIASSRNIINIICIGGVCSMATVILQAASEGKRFMYPNSYLMIHEGTQGTIDHPKNREQWERLNKIYSTKCEDIYLTKIKEKKPKFSRTKLKELLLFDTILTPKEAIDLGLVDGIIE